MSDGQQPPRSEGDGPVAVHRTQSGLLLGPQAMTPPPELLPGVLWEPTSVDGVGDPRKPQWKCAIAGITSHFKREGKFVSVSFGGGPKVTCSSDDVAIDHLRSRLRSLRDELNRLDPPEGPDWRKRADGEFPEDVHLRAVEVHIKGKFAYWDIEVGYIERGEFLTTCGDASGWDADAGTYWAPVRLPEEP